MHTSCRSLSEVAGQGSSKALTDTLLSQWSRRSGAASTRTPHLLSGDVDEPVSSFTVEAGFSAPSVARDAPLQPDSDASAAPPSIDELLAAVEDDDTDISSAAPNFLTEEKREAPRDDRGRDAALLPRADSAALPSSVWFERAGLSDTSNAARSSCTSASTMSEAALLEALLQQPFSEGLKGGSDNTTEDDVDESDEGATRAAGADPITNSSHALTHERHCSPESWQAAEIGAADDVDSDGVADAAVEPIDDALDEDESMESVLEEEAERLFRAALTNAAKAQEAATQGGVWRGLFSDCTIFPQEAVTSALESLSASDSAAVAAAPAALSQSKRSIDTASMPAVEFDDEVARKAEMESVGDVMATPDSAAAAVGKGRKR
ncbi:hypothetical protein GH5_02436 [Leishmania sp. Ghana 2012 LV757]|uniref:hypothetical protein n=1 Tax=Leishmania sp. Ghana 2012 LV757 TaxID=2803181 RepID=UPI001B5E9FC3|nr:hypothetical protein GH5_02436 [Leishmania sp. Ghana 2012 LV757]